MPWRYQQYVFTLALCLFFGYTVYKRSRSLTAGAISSWILLGSANVIFNPSIVLSLMELRLKLVSGRSFALVSMMIFFTCALNARFLPWLMLFFELSSLVNCALLLSNGHGFFNANSMDATFICMVLPLSLLCDRPWPIKLVFVGIPLITLSVAPVIGSTAIFVLLTEGLIYLALTNRWKWTVPLGIILVGGGLYINGATLYTSHDRTDQWKLLMSWWWDNANHWLGTGSGTFQWLGPAIQNKERDLFVWMHNDYLQVLFEQGLIGLFLMGCMFVVCIKKAWNRPWLLSAMGGSAFAMVTQFPLRFPLSALFILALIRISFEEVKTVEESV